MEVLISTSVGSLQGTLHSVPTSDNWVLFLSGGNVEVGRERYKKWQESLLEAGVNSLSFDYTGVHLSGADLNKSSLALRIGEAKEAVAFIKRKSKHPTITVFGSSMGGYIALGLADVEPDSIDKIVLYAPAAYAKSAHRLYFDNSFTMEIRKENSWKQSFSYQWLEETNVPVLFIKPNIDSIVPEGVYQKYVEVGSNKTNLEIFDTSGPHNCWDEHNYQEQRGVLYKKLIDFVLANNEAS